MSYFPPRMQPMTALKWNRWRGVKLHAGVVCIIALSLLILENPSAALVVGGILAAPTYFYLGLKEARQAPLWFSPLSFYFFWYTIGLGLSAIYIGSTVEPGESVSFSVAKVPIEDIALGYVIFLVGSVALHAGLQLFRPTHPEHSTANKLDFEFSPLTWLVVSWAIGVPVLWNPAWSVLLGSPGGLLQWLPLAGTAGEALNSTRG